MKLSDKLKEKRARLLAEARALTDNPNGEGGDLSADQAAKFDALKADLDKTEAAITRHADLEEAERRAAATPITGSGDQHFDAESRNFSLLRALAGAAGLPVDDGREREISQEIRRRNPGQAFQGIAVPMAVFEKRVLTTAAPAGGPGSNLIATDLRGDMFIDTLRAKSVIASSGARMLTGLVGNVDIPKKTSSAQAGWFAENTAITSSDLTFGKAQLRPKHVGALTEVSRNVLLQSSPDIEQLIRADFAALLAEALDKAAIRGGGTNEPSGILANALLIGTVDMTTGPTWAKVLELIAKVETANAEGSSFVTTPITVKKLRSTPMVSGTDSRMIMEGPAQLAGYPVGKTTIAMKAGTPDEHPLIFGQWSDLLIGMWSAFDVLVNPYAETAYSKGNVQVRGIITADIALRHPESFAAAFNVGG
ncbi:phage major capsid protein [Rhodomicrobium vannielii ATCC 17100]|uniref:phage major capsid protein n=1 Tax=Rhodomicrobium vannielii TaxID=1069 RepID=UPI0019189A00|nr:phage major capsid protein [Rhodomicrobium vannielii]MBJ7535436.1 phage major capsid protein [Rhodomicrobium vannielii ATCC 17100]